MLEDTLEFSGIAQEDMGALVSGFLRFSASSFSFKNSSTGKVLSVNVDNIEDVFWQRLANKPGVKIVTKKGVYYRFCGFKETDFNKISQFCSQKWDKQLTKQELSLKGWNYGEGTIKGETLVFEVDKKIAFEVPLSNVSNCTNTKSEVSMEFHINEECPVQLVEMRFHVPQDTEKDDDVDDVEEFRNAIMQFVKVETDQPLLMLPEILCTTPRGRYDIKFFRNQLFFHGKTHDYKIPFKTITRMFLLPHKDNRHKFFAFHINPPIRQGHTRYPFLVLEFPTDELAEVDLAITDDIINEYEGKLEKHMKGPLFEVVARILRLLVKSQIIVPGEFKSATGAHAIACALRQSSGYLYPLEKGFIYIHKQPMYVRFVEIDNIHFARSDVSTRSFDFEIVLKSGVSVLFSSVGKEEYNKLFDFVHKKDLKIRNATRLPEKPNYKENNFADSDEEMDHYKEGLKQDVRDREKMDLGSDSDSEDEDFDVEKAAKKQKAEKESSEGSASEPDEEFQSSEDSVSDDMLSKKTEKKKTEKSEKTKKDKKKEVQTSSAKGKTREVKKKKKDPNAPKKNQTAFFHWSNENRSKIKKEGDSVTDTAIRAGQLWRAMTDEEKKPYEQRAKTDKERYEREMREYKANKPESDDNAPSASTKTQQKSKKAQKAPVSSSISPAKKVVSREFVDDSSEESSAESEPAAKKSKKATKQKETTKQKTPEEESSKSSDEGSSGDTSD